MTTPKEMLAIYSTAISPSTSGELLSDFIARIHSELPNGVSDATIMNYVNDELSVYGDILTTTQYYAFVTSTGTPIITLPSSIDIESIVPDGLLVSDATGAVSSTTRFATYEYVASDDELENNSYYDALDHIGIYPMTTSAFAARIRYQERPRLFDDETSTTVRFNINPDYINIIRFKVMSRVAKTGNAPDVALANNYTMSANEIERKLRTNAAKKKAKLNRKRGSYKEGWNC